jgi:hypothetical protein
VENIPRLRDLTFGYDDADFEATHAPDLLLRGFVDHMGLAEEARNGRKFLFLGYKGSGKSALAEHLKLVAQSDPELFVEFINIDDISFSVFSHILREGIEPEARYPRTWCWLILIFLLNSFSKDEGSNFAQEEELFLTVEGLRQLGLLPEPSLSQAINKSSEKSFTVKLNTVLGSIETTTKSTKGELTDFPFFIDCLRSVAKKFRTRSRHLLIIDGFDQLLRRGNLQYDALGALIYEVNRLNLMFASSGNSAKIILLCRTDLFERLPGANKNKIRQNSAVHLSWDVDLAQPERSALVTLVNQRASLDRKTPIDVFEQYLPKSIDVYKNVPIQLELLEYTRYLPRDMINLLIKLQEFSGDGPMTRGQVINALDRYSRDYLVPEIIDEMDGYIPGEDIEFTQRLLGSIRKTDMSLFELKQQAAQLGKPSFDLKAVLEVLFNCSALGNLSPAPSGTRLVFKHQNRYASFNPSHRIFIHKGLWKGLNLI